MFGGIAGTAEQGSRHSPRPAADQLFSPKEIADRATIAFPDGQGRASDAFDFRNQVTGFRRRAACYSGGSEMVGSQFQGRIILAAAVSLAAVATADCGSGSMTPTPVIGVTAAAWPDADALFRRDPRWLGGDAAFSVALGGDRILWLFGDSFIAT
ncbi:MAG: hypothetical protein QOI66_3265, partial [Myxococcales bacterium]|nr:hypothetical protein [Myxococcales bacterium]